MWNLTKCDFLRRGRLQIWRKILIIPKSTIKHELENFGKLFVETDLTINEIAVDKKNFITTIL